MNLTPSSSKSVHQFSLIDALLVGLYDGAFPVRQVASAGGFGVGCAESLDGELIVVDGGFHLCRGDGTVTRLAPTDLLPFAEVVHFNPTFSQELDGPLNRGGIEAAIETIVPSENYFYGIRIDGTFDSVNVREATRQSKPYRPLSEAVKSQHENVISDTRGTLLGFKAPEFFQGITVAGYHLHFIDDDRETGGHSLDYVLRDGTLQIEAFAGFNVRMPNGEEYRRADLDESDVDEAVRGAEQASQQ
ncbi:acetolactate decarboxylase [Glaciibacter superstes]|uniref:acetolactate decarboxylase n=1 Tax=Glaciibacter superstes TaxID=501023 RepID=UPI00146F500E|nr:acetolactate decarboxylase [Glaciibacter superstes]